MDPTVDPHEAQRLECLHRYQVLDTPPEAEFDRITRFVRHLLEVPVVIINFVAVRRVWLKSSVGTNLHEMDRDSVCCGETVQRDDPFVVEDLHADPRFQNDPLVKFAGGRSYAGAPLITPDGYRIGTLAVYDHRPREFTLEQRTFLRDLAAIVIDTLELRLMVLSWKQAQQRSEYLAHHDALTGLPNRLMLLDRAEQALRQADRRGTPVGMLVLDLDGFKVINDSLGHAVGDALLQAVGERLSHTLRAEDTVARFGGDEFVVLLPELRGTLDAANVALKLQETLRAPFGVRNHTLVTNCSVGISLYPADGRDAETLLRAADTAMYQAKAVGKGQCCFYEEEMTRAAQEKLHLRGRLAQALERGEFRLHYQPQVDLATGRVVGLEVLLRWPQPDGGWIPPGQFIPLAESSGLIVPLGAWVLREACAQLGRWREQGCPEVDVSVNVSARQWEDPSFPEQVRRVLGSAGLPPERLVLEVTESVLFANPQGARRLALGLASLGVRVAVDDYGTGFSNLRQLQHLPIGQLKLDRSFVQPLPGEEKDQALVRSAITLAQGLNAAVVGEGIETEAQLAALRRLGCTVGQGFLLGRPVGAENFEARYLRP
ncbi:putative bifunctional diguanylate cyclase/phosphodiesterase [Deinococcus apachensis]|uniref:putative bifunctional diguanylate cyclase/phosphodiesterase n=1 Tax=Deinococcus apachensis TaxID=309886 RepID=UPI00036FD1E5|nr:EAL domain-containing protein [Deinococcus apachensis]